MINKLQLLGYMGKDPELSTTKTGNPVVQFSMATSRSWKHKETGERIKETTWHRLVCFGRLAETIGKHAKKGMLVFVEGRIKNDEWNDKTTGEKRTNMQVVGNEFQIVDWKDDNKLGPVSSTDTSSGDGPFGDGPSSDGPSDDEIPF